MDGRGKKIFKYAASAVLAAAFLYWAFRSIDIAEFWDGLCRTRWGYIILASAAAVLALVFRAGRWRLQLRSLDTGIDRWHVWHGSNIGNFLNLLLPGIGEFARCGFVRTAGCPYDRTFGTILVERSFDVLAILLLFLLSFALQYDRLAPFVQTNVIDAVSGRFDLSFGVVLLVVVVAVLIIFLIVRWGRERFALCRRLYDAVRGIFAGVGSFSRMPRPWLFAIYTIGIWTSYIFMSWFTLQAVPGLENLTFSDALFISAIGNLASVVPAPGNLGPYHWLVGTALSSIYLGSSRILPAGLLFATLGHGTRVVLVVVLGFISYICAAIRKKKPEN